MNDHSNLDRPPALEAILRETDDLGFSMASEPQTGSLLRTLAACKPADRFLELGTGTGVATAWLLAGMDRASRLETVDNDPAVVAIARRHLGANPRVTFHLNDGAAFIERQTPASYDFVFADAWPASSATSNGRWHSCASAACTSSTICCPDRTGPRGTRRKSLP
jgi:predicted O-methyltransferase YrrM